MTKISIILGVSVVLMLFIFLLVGHHRHVPDRVVVDRGALLGTGSSVAERAETWQEPAKKAAAAPTPSRR